MQTEKPSRKSILPPFFILDRKNRYVLIEDFPPFKTKEAGKCKINTLLERNNNCHYRLIRHSERFFIYKRS